MIAMLFACIGAGAICAIPLCWLWQRRHTRAGRLPDLRFELVVTDALLVHRPGVPGGRSVASAASAASAASNPSVSSGASVPSVASAQSVPRGASNGNPR
ncbi:hypothetical protein AWB81_05929 [Caballeronia arationis]|jgi:hypothetical protein|uniref:Uncharacterized protein n=1 Tax=Caballeronia arationis TaxID=1777142 RepID=A0A7Z7N0U3_9BURK|nr:hypothetical protein AWB81_05929 [Caballeronia arationis]SOE51515.1 hypothetical protein SAMN05446927_0478 [Caballeronia arationis]